MNGTVRVVPSVAAAFGELVADVLGPQRDTNSAVFFSGGPTAERCYRALAGSEAAGRIEWGDVDAYWGDERCVPLDHPDSNHRLAVDALLDRVGPVRSDHPMFRGGTPEEAAAAYQDEVAAVAHPELVHLGLGPDGHCASLFPGSRALEIDDPGVLVVASRDPGAANPHDRITLTLPAIARARLVVFTVAGATKRDALARVVAGEDLPASRVRADEIIWLVDADAAGRTPLPAG